VNDILSGKEETRARLARALTALKDLRAQVDALKQARSEPIAVIGIGCRYPGGVQDADGFWRLLRDRTDAIREVPPDRWDIESFYDADPDAPGKIATRYGGFLDHLDQFDPYFFGMAPREAASLDPQQRLLLEVAWESLEHAGLAADRLRGSRTGVFVGISGSDYGQLLLNAPPETIDSYMASGNASSVAAGRLSYVFGFEGPSLAIDTACSSSLVSVHLACQSLRLGECDVALAGGVNVILTPAVSINHSRARMLAPDGRCKTFAADADGFVRSEGCGLVVLKRLSSARADGDLILAQIRGSAVNQDGRTSGLTVPNGRAQQKVIRDALMSADVSPSDVSYVEAHGTGTSLGDPIELNALAAVFAERPPERPLVVGSVKTNLGHAEAAAGVAGLIKAVLALQHESIPANLHFSRPTPRFAWDKMLLTVTPAPMPWPRSATPRIAGVSSFGFGGTNAHVVLAEAELPVPEAAEPGPPVHVLALSARSDEALRELAGRHAQHLARTDQPLGDFCHTVNSGRSRLPHRLAAVGASHAEIETKLKNFASSQQDGSALRGKADASRPPPVAFLCTGQGAQYAGMARELFQTEPAFRDQLQLCDALLRHELDRPLLEVLYADEPDPLLHQTLYTQPALFVLEYALGALWMSWGVVPGVLVGHSVGEYAAACLAGVFSLEDGIRLIAARARLMQQLPAGGAMAAVFTGEDEVRSAIAALAPEVSVAAMNGPRHIVIAGAAARVNNLRRHFAARGIDCTALNVSHAFHSVLIEPMLDAFERVAESVRFSPPRLDLVSNVTGRRAGAEITRADYWRRHAREPVQFLAAIRSCEELGVATFLEIGPHPVLSGMARQCIEHPTAALLPSLQRSKGDWQTMMESLGALEVRGAPVDWQAVARPYGRRRVHVPTYPFQRQRYWAASRHASPARRNSEPAVEPAAGGEARLYTLDWMPQPRAVRHAEAAGGPPGRWLLLSDAGGTADTLADALAARGHQVIRVCRGQSRSEAADGTFTIDPTASQDFRNLLQRLGASRAPLRGIIHAWAVDAPSAEGLTAAALADESAAAAGSLLHLVQALLAEKPEQMPRLWLFSRAAQRVGSETPQVAQAVLWGMGKAIAREHPELWGGMIDLDPGGTSGCDAAIIDEILDPDGEDHIAYRGGRRFVARVVACDRPAPIRPTTISPDGTYLITGGCGGLGLETARWLVAQGCRHLALVGRRGATQAAQDAIAALKQRGASVTVFCADVADESRMREVLAEIRAGGLPLRGVVHAAGLPGHGTIAELDLERFKDLFAAKICGAWILHTLTRDLSLDFFVSFSSLVSLWGAREQAHYIAANHFLDCLTQYRRSLGLPALCVNWGPLRGGGMLPPQDVGELERIGVTTTPLAHATSALSTLLQADIAQAAVVAIDWPRYRAIFQSRGPCRLFDLVAEERAAPNPAPVSPPPAGILSALRDAPENERREILLAHLRATAAQVLRLEPGRVIDSRQGLFDMGMDSLTAMELRTKLQSSFAVALSATVVFDCGTLDSLADFLLRDALDTNMSCSVMATPDASAPDRVTVDMLQRMSEEEAELLLVAKLKSL
jgi:acyl transferase domain-containing protein/acyl carrier protein